MEVAIEERYIQMLAAAGLVAIEQGARDRGERVNAGRHVAQPEHRERRRPVGVANHVGHRRVAHPDVIVARAIGERPGLPESRDRAHDEPRIDLADLFPAETHPRDRSRRIVFEQDIHRGQQFLDDRETLGFLGIEAEALLAAVLLHEVRAAPILQKRKGAREISLGRNLHLDDVGAELGHQPRHGRTRERLGEVQNLVTVKDVGWLGCWHGQLSSLLR